MVIKFMHSEMKSIIFILLSWGLFSSPLYAQQSERLKILQPKQIYLIGEPIDIGLVMKTVDSGVEEYRGHVGVLYINVADEEGNALPWTMRSPNGMYVTKEDRVGDHEYYWVFDLNDFYGEWKSRFHQCFKSGRYTLGFMFVQLTKQIDTIKTSFQVVEPEGDELLVYNAFIRTITQGVGNTIESSLRTQESLVEKYPRSVYAPLILNFIESAYKVTYCDQKKTLEVQKQILLTYPNSSQNKYYIGDVLATVPSASEQIELLKNIRNNAKNSLMDKFLEMRIKMTSEN